MDEYMIVLRAIHIFAAVFWAGATLVFALFIEPTAQDLGPTGGAFMTHLAKVKNYPIVMALTSVIAIVAGALLYWRTSGHLDPDWLTSATGLSFTLGALAALVAWIVGFTVLRPTIAVMTDLGSRAEAGDTTVATQMHRLAGKLKRGSKANLVLLSGTVVAMAIARYL